MSISFDYAPAPESRSIVDIKPTYGLFIGGDFNVDSTGENVFTVLSSRFSTGGPVPIDQDGAPGTNRNRDKPYDQVLASPCLRRHQVPAVVGGSTFDAGLVFDTRVFAPIASVPPAQTGDSAAASMQTSNTAASGRRRRI